MEAEPLKKERLKELQAGSDQDIDTSYTPEIDDEFWRKAKARYPAESRKAVWICVDRDVVDWFRKQGWGCQTKMIAVLRSFYEALK